MIDIYVYIERERGAEVERKIDRKRGAIIPIAYSFISSPEIY